MLIFRSSKILIYFHGNAEDLSGAASIMTKLSNSLKCHVIGLEYPGYGVWWLEKKSHTVIIERAKRLFEFLTHDFGFKEKNIIVFGRSLGSGPATQVAAHYKPALLVLLSAYTSIKNVAKDIWWWAKCFIKERFNSLSHIKNVDCPFLLVHGDRDDVIRSWHSQELYSEGMAHEKDWDWKIMAHMDHNR